MNCPNCQTENPDEAKFCFNCGTSLSLSCSNCGTDLPAAAKFCFNCGTPTSVTTPAKPAAPDPPPAPPPAAPQPQEDLLQRYIPKGLLNKLQAAQKSGLVEGERRVVTILFCDLQGSTSAASRLDPEEWSEIINGAFEHMIAPVYRYEGTVARLMGDGLLAFFGAPIAHEDDPQRAILAGLDMLQAVRGYSTQIERDWGLPLAVRVGINTGLVVVGAVGSDLRMEYTALGDAINMAARMEQTAEPGTVQIAESTYKLVAPLFDFEDLGGITVKGIAQPVQAYRVLAVKAAPGQLRGLEGLNAPLIGRQEQMTALHTAVDDLARGNGQILSVMGEAGLGKSRLVSELHRTLDLPWVEGKSQSYETNVPYTPFRHILRAFFGLQADQLDSEQMARIREKIDTLMPGQGPAVAPFIGSLLDLTMEQDAAERIKFLEPSQLRGAIFDNVRALLKAHLAQEPLIIFLDDLHWVDPTSLELLLSLLPLVDQLPLLILTAFRPRRHEPSWGFHETAQRDFNYRYLALSLSPLDQEQSGRLVSSLLAVEDLPQSVRANILDRSEGNPFFMEEIIRSLLDQELIVRENGHWRATREIEDIAIPDTVIGVITARLDRLPENTRQIAQAAAVLGREFNLNILSDVAENGEAMDQALMDLQRRELIREKSRQPHPAFVFKHVLTQQAAYNSILLSNRRELHRRAVESLLVHTPDQAAAIAGHCLEARMPGRAMPFLIEAGNHAARAYATEEAAGYFQQAIDLGDVVDDLISLRLSFEGLGQIQLFTQQVPQAVQTFETLLALGQARNDVPAQVSALNKLANAYAMHMGRFQEAEQFLARADALEAKNTDQTGAAESALIRCQMCTMQGDFNGVILHMSNLVKVGEELGSKEYMSMGLEHVSSSLVWLTRYDEAWQTGMDALQIAREIGDREHEAMLLTMPLPYCAVRDGKLQEALDFIAEGLAIAQKIGALNPQIFGSWVAGNITMMQGDYERALAHASQALELALPLEDMMPWVVVMPLGSLGSVYLHISEQMIDEIAQFHQHALKLLENPAGSMSGGAAWAELGYCSLAIGDLELAEDSFQKGLNEPTLFIEVERPRLLSGSALLAKKRGDFERAGHLADQALAFAEERKMQHILPHIHWVLGVIEGAQGASEKALAHLQTAENQAAKIGLRPTLFEARLETANLLQALGRRQESADKRRQAQAVMEEMAALFDDQALQEAYLRHMNSKLNWQDSPIFPDA